MSKLWLILCLTFLGLRQFETKSVVLEEGLTERKPFDATNYLKLLSKVTAKPNKTSTHVMSQQLIDLSENVEQMRSFLNPLKEPPTSVCQYTVFYFSLVQAQFVDCVLINEFPFSLCLRCSQQYSDLYKAFTDLTNNSVSNCSDSFLNSDKIDSINNFFKNSISEWIDGNCDSCFSGKDEYRNLMVNNDTLYYFGLTENYTNCLQSQNQTIAANGSCVLCKDSFHSINDYYDLLSINYSSHVCNDIIYSMKDIRQHWSETLNCPIDANWSLHFLALAFLIIITPFVLYIIGRLFCAQNTNKTLLKQKRYSTYHLGSSSYESEPLVQH